MRELNKNNRLEFEQRYLNISINSKPLKPVKPRYLTSIIGTIPFCRMTKKLDQTSDQLQSNDCKLFDPLMTVGGICYSFNSLAMSELYKMSMEIQIWNKIFKLKETSTLVHPIASNGLYFVLNSFVPSPEEESSKNFVLSITNEYNSFNIYSENFIVQPGYSYKYRVIANQVVTTERFNQMGWSVRNCSLPSENKNSNLTNRNSKIGCLYECTLKKAIKQSQCVPWNVPKILPDSLEYCPINSIPFFEKMEQFNNSDCNCHSSCSKTYFSVFESKTPFKNPGYFCSKTLRDKRKTDFPNYVLCALCQKIIKEYQIKFIYEHVVEDKPDPLKSPEFFCEKLILENFALIKVEMGTKYLTRFDNFDNLFLNLRQKV